MKRYGETVAEPAGADCWSESIYREPLADLSFPVIAMFPRSLTAPEPPCESRDVAGADDRRWSSPAASTFR
jgi:hypothetical protein